MLTFNKSYDGGTFEEMTPLEMYDYFIAKNNERMLAARNQGLSSNFWRYAALQNWLIFRKITKTYNA